MNKLVVAVFLATIVSSTLAASLVGNVVRLLNIFNDNDGLGNYKYSYEQSDDTKQEQTGTLKNAGSQNPFIVVQGFYIWRAPEGDIYRVDYTADENGYKPTVSGGPGVPPRVAATMLG